MDINEALALVKNKSLNEVVTEFKGLLTDSKKDALDVVKESARQAEKAIILLAEGRLDQDDVTTLLKTQKKIAQLAVNTAKIVTAARIQKLSYRVLDIAIDVLAKAIVV